MRSRGKVSMAIKEKREKPLVQVEDGAGNGADRRAWHLAESVALKEKAHPERALRRDIGSHKAV